MKDFLILIYCLCSTLCLAQSNNVYRSEYYAILPFWESPIIPFKGAYPITQADAKSRVHLQMDYDQQNRPVSVHVKLGNHYKDFEGMFGHMYINTPKTQITYTDNTEIHHFFDRFGNQIEVMNSVYEKIYIKDQFGRNQRLIFKDREGKPTVDMFGNLVYDWTYLINGQVIEERKDIAGELTPLRRDFQLKRTRISFGSNGLVSQLENIDKNGALYPTASGAAIMKYFYDTHGRFKTWQVFDDKNQPAIGPSNTAGEVNRFEENQYGLTEIVFFDKTGGPAVHWSGAEKWKFDYDQFGNISKVTYYSAKDKPVMGRAGYSSMVYQYSEDGRFLIYQQMFDEKGQPINNANSGISSIVHQRSRNGLIVQTSFLNTQGEMVNRKDTGIAMIRYNYDDNNLLVSKEEMSL